MAAVAEYAFDEWRAFDVLPGSTIWEWKAAHVLLLVFMIWLTLHLAFRIWR